MWIASALAAASSILWSSVPLWRATPDAQIAPQSEILLSPDCRKPEQPSARRFRVTIARTEQEQAKGLSQRKRPLAPNEGMLFWFDPPRPQAIFWMKDTLIPLTLLYLDWDGKLVDQFALTVEADPTQPKKLYPSRPTRGGIGFALEIAPGQKWDPETRLCLPHAPLR